MKKSIISRTIIRNVAHTTTYNSAKHEIDSGVVIVPANVNTCDRAEKFIRKNNSYPSDVKLVSVDAIEKIETLVGMYVDDFVANAKKVDERSKETRNAITKTVVAAECTILCMSPDRKVYETKVITPVNCNYDSYIRKNFTIDGKFIEVYSVHEISELYAMDEATFIALAKPMKNKFQLDD